MDHMHIRVLDIHQLSLSKRGSLKVDKNLAIFLVSDHLKSRPYKRKNMPSLQEIKHNNKW